MWALLSLSAALAVNDPPLPPAPIIIANTNPATFTLQWLSFDPVVGATTYRVFVSPITALAVEASTATNAAPAAPQSTNFDTPNVSVQIPHLRYGQKYSIQVQGYSLSATGPISASMAWPQTLTNFATLSFQHSDDMKAWSNFGPSVVVTNPTGFFRIAGPMTNNADIFQVKE